MRYSSAAAVYTHQRHLALLSPTMMLVLPSHRGWKHGEDQGCTVYIPI